MNVHYTIKLYSGTTRPLLKIQGRRDGLGPKRPEEQIHFYQVTDHFRSCEWVFVSKGGSTSRKFLVFILLPNKLFFRPASCKSFRPVSMYTLAPSSAHPCRMGILVRKHQRRNKTSNLIHCSWILGPMALNSRQWP